MDSISNLGTVGDQSRQQVANRHQQKSPQSFALLQGRELYSHAVPPWFGETDIATLDFAVTGRPGIAYSYSFNNSI